MFGQPFHIDDHRGEHVCHDSRRYHASCPVREAASRGFDAGSFAGAYSGTFDDQAEAREAHLRRPDVVAAFCQGYLLGFYSSHELHEIGSPEHRESVKILRPLYPEWCDE